MSKRGLSEVVSTMILIVLVVAAVGVLGTIINSVVNKKIDDASSCFGISDELRINKKFSCIHTDGKLQLFIEIGDITPDKILISVIGEEDGELFEISENSTPGLIDSKGDVAKIPQKFSGNTYNITTDFSIKQVRIAPYIRGNTCEVSDTFSSIPNC